MKVIIFPRYVQSSEPRCVQSPWDPPEKHSTSVTMNPQVSRCFGWCLLEEMPGKGELNIFLWNICLPKTDRRRQCGLMATRKVVLRWMVLNKDRIKYPSISSLTGGIIKKKKNKAPESFICTSWWELGSIIRHRHSYQTGLPMEKLQMGPWSRELCLDHTPGAHFVNHGKRATVSSHPSL